MSLSIVIGFHNFHRDDEATDVARAVIAMQRFALDHAFARHTE